MYLVIELCLNTARAYNRINTDENMVTSSIGNIFRVTGHLCGEFTGPNVDGPNWDQISLFETQWFQTIRNETSLAPRGRSFLTATQNETIWDQQCNHFSLPTQNESFLVLMIPKCPIESFFGPIV